MQKEVTDPWIDRMVVTTQPNHLSPRPATVNRNPRNVLNQSQTAIARRSQATQPVEFFNVLTSPQLLQTTEALLPEHRERLPDTPENQEHYPQPSTQAPGVGFPAARLVIVICLATGAALDMAVGPHSGKGSGELGLVRNLLQGFSKGDVMLGRCPVLQLLADCHADGQGCGRAI